MADMPYSQAAVTQAWREGTSPFSTTYCSSDMRTSWAACSAWRLSSTESRPSATRRRASPLRPEPWPWEGGEALSWSVGSLMGLGGHPMVGGQYQHSKPGEEGLPSVT